MSSLKEEGNLEKILPSNGPSINEVKKYLSKYKNEFIILKIGSVLDDANLFKTLIEDICILKKLGFNPILIHGGGKKLTNKLNQSNIKSDFINGLRVTDNKIINVVEEVFLEFNKEIINEIKKNSINTASISNKENNIIPRSIKKSMDEILGATKFAEAFKENEIQIKRDIKTDRFLKEDKKIAVEMIRQEMLEAAVSVLNKVEKRPLLIGVTLLTSLDQISIEKIGIKINLKDQVIRLTKMCKEKGLDGVVCSPQEISDIRKEIGKDFLLVTPGIRSLKVENDDQKRTSTVSEAIGKGADYVVIGREITSDKDPNKKIQKILETV